jgi:hypothetical protein
MSPLTYQYNLGLHMLTYTDCIVADGGYPTADGYIRVLTKLRKDGGKLKMLHRIEWEKLRGPIPEGYTVDHKCKNRQCQNINHLQLLPHSAHVAKDNGQRYLERTVESLHWIAKNPNLSPKEVSAKLGVKRAYVESLSRDYPEVRKFLNMRELKSRPLKQK